VQGRPTRGFGDNSFEYAGKLMNPEPWDNYLDGGTYMIDYKSKAEEIASNVLERDVKFTFCLCGLYLSGKDSVPHHSDTVPMLDDIVLSLSFGAARVFEWIQYSYNIKKKTNTSHINVSGKYDTGSDRWTQNTERYILSHGDAILFDGESQMTSTHAVPEVINVGERINLTFRTGL
jgi:alkylated DNA repair dioxygenase AlkB